MRSRLLSLFLSSVLLLSVLAVFEIHAQQSASKGSSTASWKAVDDAMGRTGQDQGGSDSTELPTHGQR